jgi:hypothetical protein
MLVRSCLFRWGRSHSAYISESATIQYRWSGLFGASLSVLRKMHRQDGEWLILESPEGNAIAIPSWMTDQSLCAAFSAGPPVVSVSALRALRIFLDGLHPTAECGKPTENASPMEFSDEATEKSEPDADRTISRAKRSDSRRSRRRSRNGAKKTNRRVTPKVVTRQRRGPKRR